MMAAVARQSRRRDNSWLSGGGEGIQDPLNATTTTTNLTMNVKGKMQMMTSSTPQEEGGGDNSS